MGTLKSDMQKLAEIAVDVLSEEIGLCFEKEFRQKLEDKLSKKFINYIFE
jgi:hypothetical protein